MEARMDFDECTKLRFVLESLSRRIDAADRRIAKLIRLTTWLVILIILLAFRIIFLTI